MIHAIPDCFGEYVCPDDCNVSCAYWEECMEEHYCVFCAKTVSDEWWKSKSYFERRIELRRRLKSERNICTNS